MRNGDDMEKYRMYVDEVGNSDMGSSDNPNHRFLSLTGVIFGLTSVRETLHPEMEELKSRYFGSHPDEPIILHRKELLNAKPPFAALKDDDLRERFNSELLASLHKWDYTVITVCLDQKQHRDKYTVWRYDPYNYCTLDFVECAVFSLSVLGVISAVLV